MTEDMAMTAQIPAIDPKIFSLLTGELGTNQAIGKLCADLAQVISAFLPDLVETDTQLKLNFYYEDCETGYKNDLIADLDDYMVLVDGSLKNWCSDFTIACPATVIMTMVECLMGGDPDAIIEPVPRPASSIELEMTPLITDKIASVIKSAVNAPGNFEPLLSKPYNAAKRPKPADDYVDMHAALLRMKVEFGSLVTHFAVIIPQKTLLKTVVKAPVAVSTGGKSADWAELIKEQVRRSEVKVEARIHLTPLKLGTISKLQPGDVIPFLDKSDVRVQVSANGRDLYSCEFGRSGEQYTVRVKDTAGSEEDLIRDILG
jgi:flagellar motor switch protein FliM